MPDPTPAKAPTEDQLRGDIDSGRTGDKVDWPDPAAAPLGADAEAAGTPTPARSRRQDERASAPDRAPQTPHRRGWRGFTAYVVIAVAILVVVVLIASFT